MLPRKARGSSRKIGSILQEGVFASLFKRPCAKQCVLLQMQEEALVCVQPYISSCRVEGHYRQPQPTLTRPRHYRITRQVVGGTWRDLPLQCKFRRGVLREFYSAAVMTGFAESVSEEPAAITCFLKAAQLCFLRCNVLWQRPRVWLTAVGA